jgi:hypothetical protein
MIFEQAFDKLIAGEKITVPSSEIWRYGKTYWELVDGEIKERSQYTNFTVRFSNLTLGKSSWPTGWELYKVPLLFKDLKPGQRFRYISSDLDCMKVGLNSRPFAYMRLNDFYVLDSINPGHEVILID